MIVIYSNIQPARVMIDHAIFIRYQLHFSSGNAHQIGSASTHTGIEIRDIFAMIPNRFFLPEKPYHCHAHHANNDGQRETFRL